MTYSKAIKLIISLGIGGILIWYVQKDLTESDKDIILNSFRHIKLPATIITIILAVVACILRGLRWEMLLKPMGYKPRKSVLIASIFVMYLANLLFPRLGEVLRCTILNEQEDIPMEKSLGTMIVERMVDVLSSGVILLLAIFFEFDKLKLLYESSKSNTSSQDYTKYIIFGIVILGLILASIFVPKIRNFIIEKLKGLLDGIRAISQLERPLLFILYSLGIYGIYFSTTYIMYHSLDGLESLNIQSVFLVLTAGTVGIGMAQGGIGAFQLLVTKALELYQIPSAIGLAYGWLIWIVQTMTLVVFGLISWIYLNLKKSRNDQKT